MTLLTGYEKSTPILRESWLPSPGYPDLSRCPPANGVLRAVAVLAANLTAGEARRKSRGAPRIGNVARPNMLNWTVDQIGMTDWLSWLRGSRRAGSRSKVTVSHLEVRRGDETETSGISASRVSADRVDAWRDQRECSETLARRITDSFTRTR